MKKLCISLILLVLSVGAQASLSDAQRLYDQGRLDEALSTINAMLVDTPNDAEARFLKGIIHAEAGDSDSAIETFAALTQDFPELPEPWNNLAVLFAERGEFDKSREALLAAIQTHPSYSTAHENLGDLYARMAGMAYDRALEQDRSNDSARLKLSAVNGLFAVPGTAPPPVAVAAAPVQSTPPVSEPVAQPVSEPVASTPEPEPAQPVAAATPEPTVMSPEPVASTPAPSSASIEAAVNRWASAWSSKDVDRYLASYVSDFRPSNGASHRAWVDYRRDRLTRPKVIEVDVSALNVSFDSDTRATATFRQKYRSDNYRDEVTKKLVLSNENGRWLIVSEVSE
ncbi:MAG: tetratricopeptide repeat protein [Pseudomonadota bacterium]